MQFQNYADRHAAIKAASELLGLAYGEMKFKEQMFREACQSFVKGEAEQGPKVFREAADAVEKHEAAKAEEPKPKKKPGPKKKVKKEEPEPVEDAGLSVAEEEDTKVEESAVVVESECPVDSVDALRNYLTERYTELGGTQEVRAKLLEALKESTGCAQAADVTDDKFEAAYAAISKVEA